MKLQDPFKTKKKLKENSYYYSLPELGKTFPTLARMPVSLRLLLESLLRNCDGILVKEEDVKNLANLQLKNQLKHFEVPFIVSRVILQDFTGVPLLVDLAAMRDALVKRGIDSSLIEPKVPVDLVIDHSVQVDRAGTKEAFSFNLEVELKRNLERYAFLKWGQNAFKKFKVIPPAIGIVHQVNLEFLATVVTEKKEDEETILFPDTLVGTDSHTPMINGLGVLGWGVGGIEAESAMVGFPISMDIPEVVGVHLRGTLKEGVTATDLTLFITERLRKEKVVGKFVEFFGEGASSLSVETRATIGNMAPEYGATIGFFPVDEKTLDYLRLTGRAEDKIEEVKDYFVAQELFGIKKLEDLDFSSLVEIDLNVITASIAGPKRPQDRIDLNKVKNTFGSLLKAPLNEGGYHLENSSLDQKICIRVTSDFPLAEAKNSGGIKTLGNSSLPLPWDEVEMVANRPFTESLPILRKDEDVEEMKCDGYLSHGSIVIAAITSCTNTSNPHVMIGAGLLAKKAFEKGLRVNKLIKTSLAPGSRVVTDYLKAAGLDYYLNALGFNLVGYGCTTCIGNSGPLDEVIESAIKKHNLVAAAVLSGNRNFEARIHSSVKANFLMSPPLVVAFAIAGSVEIDMEKEPLGFVEGTPIFLKEIWPTNEEIEKTIEKSLKKDFFTTRYQAVAHENPAWDTISTSLGENYHFDENSSYIQNPPYFEEFKEELIPLKSLKEMRPLAFFGDSVTTDHISPAGSIDKSTPAGQYLLSLGIEQKDFNSYGSRRGNHLVMMRGTFANVRIKNQLAEGKEGGFTQLMPEKKLMTIFEASQIYRERGVPLIIFAGRDYGMGSSRDWAAKGPLLLGVKAVVAKSFERIHRSNLVGMGILPLEFLNEDDFESLNLTGEETFTINGFEKGLKPRQEMILEIKKGSLLKEIKLLLRLDTPLDVEYYRQGGVLPFMLRQTLSK